MRVLVVGLRGLPNVEGGVERHAEQLYPELDKLGAQVEIAVRAPFHSKSKPASWNNLTYRRFWSPKANGLEAFVHTFIAIFWAIFSRPDIVHLHAVGPGLFVPMAKLFGLKVVFTHHGPDYDREKWGRAAKSLLMLGESLACRFSDEVIVISKTIQDLVKTKYNRLATLVPNGVIISSPEPNVEFLASLGLEPGKYILQVSRLVPEKRQLDLIEAFVSSDLKEWKLAIVGTISDVDPYTQKVLAAADASEDVVITGFRTGPELAAIYSDAGVFVLPSTHEGLPIALLEALSYGLYVVASDIPANKEIGLLDQHYFTTGNVDALAATLTNACSEVADNNANNTHEKQHRIDFVAKNYNWSNIAKDIFTLYQAVTPRR